MSRCYLLLATLVLVSLAAPVSRPINTSFENWPAGSEYTRDKAEQDFGAVSRFDVDSRATVELSSDNDDDDDKDDDDRILHVKFPRDNTGEFGFFPQDLNLISFDLNHNFLLFQFDIMPKYFIWYLIYKTLNYIPYFCLSFHLFVVTSYHKPTYHLTYLPTYLPF